MLAEYDNVTRFLKFPNTVRWGQYQQGVSEVQRNIGYSPAQRALQAGGWCPAVLQ